MRQAVGPHPTPSPRGGRRSRHARPGLVPQQRPVSLRYGNTRHRSSRGCRRGGRERRFLHRPLVREPDDGSRLALRGGPDRTTRSQKRVGLQSRRSHRGDRDRVEQHRKSGVTGPVGPANRRHGEGTSAPSCYEGQAGHQVGPCPDGVVGGLKPTPLCPCLFTALRGELRTSLVAQGSGRGWSDLLPRRLRWRPKCALGSRTSGGPQPASQGS